VPKLTLDETFEQQSGISVAVKTELDAIMSGFGFNILTALVTDIIPDAKVKDAMNDINAAQRAQVAAQARGEADKILKVKQAEAEAESKALQGKGIAAERQAIIDGLRASIENFQRVGAGRDAEDVMALVLLTQYFDTLKDIGTKGGTIRSFCRIIRGGERFYDADPGRAAGSMNAGAGSGGVGLPVVNPWRSRRRWGGAGLGLCG
jgi:regulator of protease activity HflC (stomatin/prohibitin superfamily)